LKYGDFGFIRDFLGIRENEYLELKGKFDFGEMVRQFESEYLVVENVVDLKFVDLGEKGGEGEADCYFLEFDCFGDQNFTIETEHFSRQYWMKIFPEQSDENFSFDFEQIVEVPVIVNRTSPLVLEAEQIPVLSESGLQLPYAKIQLASRRKNSLKTLNFYN
jgi:hypothetical protein